MTGGTEAPYSPYGVQLEPGSGDVGAAPLELPGDRSADALGLPGRGRLELDHVSSLAGAYSSSGAAKR